MLRAPAEVREVGAVPGARVLAVGGGASLVAAATPAGVERIDLAAGSAAGSSAASSAAGARATLPLRGVQALAFDGRGVLWLVNEAGLWRWDGAAAPRAIAGVGRDAAIYARASGGVLAWSAEGVLLQLDGAGAIERRIQTERLRGEPAVSGDRGAVAWRRLGGIDVLDLATGITRSYPRDGLLTGLALDASGRALAATATYGRREAFAAVWTAAPPLPSRWALRGWLDRATNAALAPASADVLEWR